MKKLTHKAILASAGSGKTFQLAHRYIRLLSEKDQAGVNITPDRICAMTFTRKAAGEIFDEIAKYLRRAATDTDGAVADTNGHIGMNLSREEYLALLRRFIDGMHRSRIGTLDSFIVGIAKAFPVELGMPMSFQVMDTGGAAAKEMRRRILDHILSQTGPNAVSSTFLDAFKQATYGIEEKSMGKVLDGFLTDLGFQYRLCPDGSKWGNDKLIWGDGCPFKILDVDGAKLAGEITEWVAAQPRAKKTDHTFYDKLTETANALAGHTSASIASKLLKDTVFKRMRASLDAMRVGAVQIKYGTVKTPYIIDDDISGKFACLINNLLAVEYQRMLSRTAGLYTLLETYENEYQDIARATGIFSFTDIQYLLSGADETAPHISREQGGDRLYIDYRMDCRLDHWLLDEFQDTSDLQWGVFENLIEEVIQAESGRSFFYVGDVKQAVYGWRGGNHKLFKQILDKYNGSRSDGDKLIEEEPMQKTWRCSQAVIDTVNTVFSNLPEELPQSAVKEWCGVWRDHETASVTKEQGYVSLLDIPYEGSDGNKTGKRSQLVADLLNEMQPVKRNLKVGILVRDNKYGKKLVNHLAKECPDMNFVHEGEASITENEVAALLVNMVKVAGHPGDDYAWKYIQMTPMLEILGNKGITRGNVSVQLLQEIQEKGYQAFIRNWGGRLAETLARQGAGFGSYGIECLKRLESAAAEFDALGKLECDGFLRYMDSYTTREQPSSQSVRVMTIHQSKGLEFDVVILPELQDGKSGNMAKESRPKLILKGERNDPEWLLKMPARELAENDPCLVAQLDASNAEHCFSALCTLYVAMTRARHGLYMITSAYSYKKPPESIHASVLLKEQLAGEKNPEVGPNVKINGADHVCLYETSNGAEWYKDDWPIVGKEPEVEEITSLPDDYADREENSKILKHKEPSKQGAISRSAGSLFESKSADIMNFGSAIHELFEMVEWADDADVDKIVKDWEPTSSYDAEVTKDVIIQFRNCMNSDAIRNCLSKPEPQDIPRQDDSQKQTQKIPSSGGVDLPTHQARQRRGGFTLWLEKSFEVVLDNAFVSGAFDRVTIIRDEQGTPVSATIFDYKSSMVNAESEIDEKVKGYIPQMHTYRDALSVILNLPPDKITLNLLFTKQQILRKL